MSVQTPRSLSFPRSYLSALCSLAIPVMLEQLSQVLLGTVDTFFAGQLGDNAIAAVNVTNMFMNLFATVFVSFGIGVMVMISHALGESDRALAGRTLRQTLLVGAGVSAALGLLSFVCRMPFLRFAGAEGEILAFANVYFQAVCVPCVFMCLTIILSNGLKASGKARVSMCIALLANVTNALLDALAVHLGLGILGLGLATTISRLLSFCLLLLFYRHSAAALPFRWTRPYVEPRLMRKILSYSAPIMLTQLAARTAVLLHGSLVLRLGSIYYIANSIALTLDEYACIPSAGFEAAAAALVSNSLGAEKPKDAVCYTRIAFYSNAACMTLIGLLLALFAVPLSGLFTQTEAIWRMVKQVLTLMVFFNWTSALSHIFTSAVQGTGNSRYPLYVTLAGNVLLRLGAGYVLAYLLRWNLMGIWVGIVLDFLFRGILLRAFFLRTVPTGPPGEAPALSAKKPPET